MMHRIYLPFSEQVMRGHFAPVKVGQETLSTADKHLNYYRKSLENHIEFCAEKKERTSLKDGRKPCQVEKDEKFWTAACLMTVFHSVNAVAEWTRLLRRAFGDAPPVEGLDSWETCLRGELHLFFEANLPSPQVYKKWLRRNLTSRQFIPYILASDDGEKALEGPTNVDGVLLNSEHGFAVIAEAKVLSDISHDVTYDVMRNQIARNIDVMLEDNGKLCPPLNARKANRTLFLLLTPRIFKNNPTSRVYGYKFNDYTTDPNSIGRDLPNRTDQDWRAVSGRLGWLTWEDFREVNSDCCTWLDREGL
jgi:hypothetical protein